MRSHVQTSSAPGPLQNQTERPSPCDEVPNELPPAGSHAGSCTVSGYADLTCCVEDGDWIGALISHDPLWDSGCKPNSPVSLSDTSVWVVTELPGGDIEWWMRLNSSVCVCLFHLITSLNYSVLLNVLSAAPLFLSLSFLKVLIGLFLCEHFSSQPSTQYYLLAELFALLSVTFSWRLPCNATGSYWKVGWRCHYRILFLPLFAYRPCTHIKTETFTSQAKHLHEAWAVRAQFYSPAGAFTDAAVCWHDATVKVVCACSVMQFKDHVRFHLWGTGCAECRTFYIM